jgi:hypothetical protein
VRLTLEASPSPAAAAAAVNAGTVSRLTLVDLAGSEGAEAAAGTANEGQLAREAAGINKSLLQLQRVFTALAENKKKKDDFQPFRGFKLTELLRVCLGRVAGRGWGWSQSAQGCGPVRPLKLSPLPIPRKTPTPPPSNRARPVRRTR